MIVEVTRSGGFAGTVESRSVDTSGLGTAQATYIEKCIAALDDLYQRTEQPLGADMFRFEIEVHEHDGRSHKLAFVHSGDPEEPLPAALAQLLEIVHLES